MRGQRIGFACFAVAVAAAACSAFGADDDPQYKSDDDASTDGGTSSDAPLTPDSIIDAAPAYVAPGCALKAGRAQPEPVDIDISPAAPRTGEPIELVVGSDHPYVFVGMKLCLTGPLIVTPDAGRNDAGDYNTWPYGVTGLPTGSAQAQFFGSPGGPDAAAAVLLATREFVVAPK